MYSQPRETVLDDAKLPRQGDVEERLRVAALSARCDVLWPRIAGGPSACCLPAAALLRVTDKP